MISHVVNHFNDILCKRSSGGLLGRHITRIHYINTLGIIQYYLIEAHTRVVTSIFLARFRPWQTYFVYAIMAFSQECSCSQRQHKRGNDIQRRRQSDS